VEHLSFHLASENFCPMKHWDFSMAHGEVCFYNRVPIIKTIFSARV